MKPKHYSYSDLAHSRFYIYIDVGLKDLAKPSPFHIKSKTHVEEEEMPEDEQRESRLPGYTAEDDLVLDKPKSRKGKNATSLEAVPLSILKEVSSPMGQP